jgi:hypothetical protein
LFEKHACLSDTAGAMWKLIGTRSPTSRCACLFVSNHVQL